jgi:hypothetical protein
MAPLILLENKPAAPGQFSWIEHGQVRLRKGSIEGDPPHMDVDPESRHHPLTTVRQDNSALLHLAVFSAGRGVGLGLLQQYGIDNRSQACPLTP